MTDKKREKTRIAVYLLGKRGDTVLLAKRKNTGHMDGHWSLVAGHVFEGESSTQALLREAQEECGISLDASDLRLIGAMHHYSDPFDYVNFIFEADLTNHEPVNKEEHKCETLEFYPINQLPVPMSEYILQIIQESFSDKDHWICEFGWK